MILAGNTVSGMTVTRRYDNITGNTHMPTSFMRFRVVYRHILHLVILSQLIDFSGLKGLTAFDRTAGTSAPAIFSVARLIITTC